MNNMESIISNHNRKLLQNVENSNQQTRKECNCSNGVVTCPVNGKCLHGNIIYKAAVTTSDDNQTFQLHWTNWKQFQGKIQQPHF